ncbi:MAG: 2-oxo acid dehydrogenase subunit E2 [Nitrospirae bacterium]|nr:2-oxo acid dehydrogenase subunit E2 [Nitrospirota bacterium]
MAGRIIMPKLSDTMEEGVLVKWLKREGQAVASGDAIAEVETDKAVLELEAYTDGVLRRRLVDEGARVPVGTLLGVIAGESEAIDALLAENSPVAVEVGRGERPFAPTQGPHPIQASVIAQVAHRESPALSGSPSATKASPLARKLAEQRGVDFRTIQGTGPGGRIVERDVDAAAASPGPTVTPIPVVGDRREPLSLMRATIAKRMAESKATVPHFYVTTEIDAGKLLEVKARFADTGEPKIGVTELLVKAMGQALVAVPRVNASFGGNAVVYHAGSHVGVAVALEEGIITPVVRDADRKSIGQIAEELADFTARARRKALKPEEYQGAGVSLSNLGMFRVDEFSAIITPPEAAVLAVGRIIATPVVREGKIEPGHRMRMTLSADHRVIDGVIAAKYLEEVAARLENPWRLFR